LDIQPREHVDQRVSAQEIDSTLEQVAHTRLGDLEGLRCLSLCDAARCDSLLHFDKEIGAHEKMLSFLGVEADVPKHVVRRARDPSRFFCRQVFGSRRADLAVP
jgi:hypothetical protein